MGRVAYFLKATPRSTQAAAALQALGLPTEPQRIAMVDAYSAQDVQGGLSDIDMKVEWVSCVADALVKAGLLRRRDGFLGLLQHVRNGATVLAVGPQAKVELTQRSSQSGTLRRIAVPLSSKYEVWYHKPGTEGANWAVYPVCRIDPRKAKVGNVTLAGGGRVALQSAIHAVQNRLLYFVHTYSRSNSKL